MYFHRLCSYLKMSHSTNQNTFVFRIDCSTLFLKLVRTTGNQMPKNILLKSTNQVPL